MDSTPSPPLKRQITGNMPIKHIRPFQCTRGTAVFNSRWMMNPCLESSKTSSVWPIHKRSYSSSVYLHRWLGRINYETHTVYILIWKAMCFIVNPPSPDVVPSVKSLDTVWLWKILPTVLELLGRQIFWLASGVLWVLSGRICFFSASR